MKLSTGRQARILPYVYRGLIIFLIILGLIFIGGTIYGVFSQAAIPESKQNLTSQISGEEQTFTGIGRIRVATNDPQPGMVIIYVTFVYHPEDKYFSEELALRIGDFRNIIREYIGSFPIAELQQLGEESIRAELLRRLNAILRLGQIEFLYFSDFMIVG